MNIEKNTQITKDAQELQQYQFRRESVSGVLSSGGEAREKMVGFVVVF